MARRRSRRVVIQLVVMGAIGAALGVVLSQPGPAPETAIQAAADEAIPEFVRPAEGRVQRVPAPPAALAGLPPYPGARPEGLGERMFAQGVPLSTAWFATEDAPEAVVAFYEDRLAEAGFAAVSTGFANGIHYVGYRELETNQMHVVTVVPYGDTTLVLPSSGNGRDLLHQKADVPEVLPHPQEAERSMVFVVDDAGGRQHSVVASVPLGDMATLVAFYEKGFTQKGWTGIVVHRERDDAVQVEAKKDALSARTTLRRKSGRGGEPEVQIFVMMQEKA